jgi:AraC family transcriptional regulator of adaptative response / DNA-3-methyladenine glycosylase II
MTLQDDAAYVALKARDARFDGRFFVAVTSTRIYCRPVCPVRTPMRKNCRFFVNAASAERQGFRPCLRCRPELAPGLSLIDSSQVLATQAARLITQAAHDGTDLYLPQTAARLGVTDRHLRRIFSRAHGVTPVEYLGTQRLLMAKHLLTDTELPITQVALASGFASLRRFNAAFLTQYRMNPSALRKQRASSMPAAAAGKLKDNGGLSVRLAYRAPYDVEGTLGFIERRCLDGVEVIEGRQWRRTLGMDHGGRHHQGWLSCHFDSQRSEARLTVSPSLVQALGSLMQRTRHALDLDAEPALIDAGLLHLPLAPRPGLRLPGAIDGFEIASRIILGQQVTVAAARTLSLRLVNAYGMPIDTPFADLRRLYPLAATIAAADPAEIGRLGIVRQRVRALQALAREVADRRIELHPGAPLQPTLAALRALPGIGEWTVQLIAMRVLAWPDAFVPSDIGVLNALKTRDVAQVQALSQAWRPWRGYAVMRLWQSLEEKI